MLCITTGATEKKSLGDGFNPSETYTLNVVLFDKRMHQSLRPAVTEMAYLR